MASDEHEKPMLTTAEQIAHMKSKGIKFDLCNEEDACAYLETKNNFIRTYSYRCLFDKYVGGKHDGEYINLDFGYLKSLSLLDQKFRSLVLSMSLDVEHFVKVELLTRISSTECEDGYSIVYDYRNSLTENRRKYLDGELASRKSSNYTASIASKYEEGMPVWVLFELISFGTLIDFIKFCSSRWDDKGLNKDYYTLKAIKSARNAAAHGTCMLNAIGTREPSHYKVHGTIANALAAIEISKNQRARWLKNECMQQVASLIVFYSQKVPTGTSFEVSRQNLDELYDSSEEASELIGATNPALSALSFVKRLTVAFGLS